MELGAGREHVRVARALGSLPRLADALGRGELSYSKVRALTRVATPETEERLLAVGRAGTACHVERIVRGWRRVDRLAEAREDSSPPQGARPARVSGRRRHGDDPRTADARAGGGGHAGAGRGRRDAVPARAPRGPAGLAEDVPAETPSRSSSKRTRSPCSPRPPSITASTPAPRASATRSSSTSTPRCWPILTRRASPSSTAARTFPRKRPGAWRATRPGCSCGTSRTGRIVEVGARTRTIPPAIRRALHHRDRGCRFPGCGSGSARAITSATGPRAGPPRSRTSRCCAGAITVPSTRRDSGWNDSPTATLRFRRPDGRLLPDVPPPPAVPGDPAQALRARNEALGSGCTRERRARAGRASVSTWAGRSTSCIRAP